MYKDFIGYAKDPKNTETNYCIEYIDDAKDWERFLDDKCDWTDVCKTKQFADIKRALTFYMIRLFDDTTYDVKMWQEIAYKTENVFEEFIELEGHIENTIRKMIDRKSYDYTRRLERENEQLAKANTIYEGFLDQFGDTVKRQFKKYYEEVSENDSF